MCHWSHYHWPLVDITWLVPGLTGHTITGPLVDITWLVTATHWTHYHWPTGRHYLAGDCDSLDHYHWPAGRYYLAGDCDSLDTLSLARWEILPGWWLWLTVHTITGPLGDITWLVTVTHRTHYHWPAGRYYLAGDCDSLDHYHWPAGRYYLAGDCDSLYTLSLARWEIWLGWWLRLTGHTITGPLVDITWLVTATHWTVTITGPLVDITWLVSVTHRTHYHCPLVDITWLVTATHWTHYHWPTGRHYLAGDCDSLHTLSSARWETLPGWWLWLTGHTITGPLGDIPGWWLRLTGHTITGPLGDITWLATVTHRTHYHWPAGRYYLPGDCHSLDTLSLARWEHYLAGDCDSPDTQWTHYHWPTGRHYLAGDCDSLNTLSLAHW